MSIQVPSRELSLANVHARIAASQDLSARRRQDMLSALNRLSAILERSLETLPAARRELGRLLVSVSAADRGMKASSWGNLRSRVNKALDCAGVGARPDFAPVSEPWCQLVQRLTPSFRRIALQRCLRWLSAHQIDPASVSVSALTMFLEDVGQNSLKPDPGNVYRNFVKSWNFAADNVPGWPSVRLPTSKRPDLCLPWSSYPGSLQDDVSAYLAGRVNRNPFSKRTSTSAIKKVTADTYRVILRSFASSLVRKGVDANSLTSIEKLITGENFVLGLTEMFERSGETVTPTILRRGHFLIGIARHYVRVDYATLETMRADVKEAAKAVTHRGMTPKNRERLLPFRSDVFVRSFLRVPERLKARVLRQKMTPVRAAETAMRAAAIAILSAAPIRIKNLRQIEIGKQLQIQDRRLLFLFDEEEVKNGVHLAFEIEDEPANVVLWYIEKHRPLINPANSSHLFPGRNGGERSACGMSMPIMKALSQELGVSINPHLFRHIAAKILLDQHPEQVEVVRQLLGHTSIATTMKFYAEFNVNSAARKYQALIRMKKDSE